MYEVSQRVIAIDGPAGAGKSTVSLLLAQRLEAWFLSSGLVYRAIAWHAMQNSLPGFSPPTPVQLDELNVRLDEKDVWVNEVRVDETLLKTEEVSKQASAWAMAPQVRQKANAIQRTSVAQACKIGVPWVVLEGRDIATHVFPNARWMFFLTASVAVRAQRRRQQLMDMFGKAPALNTLIANIQARDAQDANRDIAPMQPAQSARRIDVGQKTLPQVVSWLENLILQGNTA